jgi:hypothetical protein
MLIVKKKKFKEKERENRKKRKEKKEGSKWSKTVGPLIVNELSNARPV